MQFRRVFNKEQVYQKLRHYCAYQERCEAEVVTKAYSLGLHKADIEELLVKLRDDGYVNDDRFAGQFASGKFRIKQWGKIKIAAELKKKRINKATIDAATGKINEEEYFKVIEKLARKKWSAITGKGTNLFVKLTKTRNYLLTRGFEPALINKELAKLSAKEKAP